MNITQELPMSDINQDNQDFRRLLACHQATSKGWGDNFSVIPVVAPISTGVMADAFACIEGSGRTVSQVRMHPQDFADIRSWPAMLRMSPFRPFADPETIKGIRVRGTLWDATVITDITAPKGFPLIMARFGTADLDQLIDGPGINGYVVALGITR
jgi:hypothetical protein